MTVDSTIVHHHNNKREVMGSVNDLIVYKKAFNLAMEIFDITKLYPNEEKYSLVSQIRRSSRSVCANLAEGYRKRQYPAHFASKISDADMENSETQTWLEFSLSCQYLELEKFNSLFEKSKEIGKLLSFMHSNSEKFLTIKQKNNLQSKSC